MKTRPSLRIPLKITCTGLFLLAGLLLSRCTRPAALPESALAALYAQWESLPGSETHDLMILRAWPGKVPPDGPAASSPSMEIWCVETELAGKQPDAAAMDSVLWFLVRASNDAGWESAPLMTMSSSWPYEACGVDL